MCFIFKLCKDRTGDVNNLNDRYDLSNDMQLTSLLRINQHFNYTHVCLLGLLSHHITHMLLSQYSSISMLLHIMACDPLHKQRITS